MPPPHTRATLVADLQRLGVQAADLVMVHASLRAIGPVEGGAATLLGALEDVIGVDGTIMMVLGALDDWDWVNQRQERAELLTGTPPFDPLTTPADPEVGALGEYFRTRPGTVVSNHPEGRFAAAGHLADELTTDVPWHDYYGPGSPLQRLVDRSGRVLRLGADPDTVTLLHYAEYLVPLPDKRRVRRHRVVIGRHGPEIRVIECLDDSDGIVDYPGEDYFKLILEAYLGESRGSRGSVGSAPSELLEAADLVDFAVRWMAGNLANIADD